MTCLGKLCANGCVSLLLLPGSLDFPSTTQTCPTWAVLVARSCWADHGVSPSSATYLPHSRIILPATRWQERPGLPFNVPWEGRASQQIYPLLSFIHSQSCTSLPLALEGKEGSRRRPQGRCFLRINSDFPKGPDFLCFPLVQNTAQNTLIHHSILITQLLLEKKN